MKIKLDLDTLSEIYSDHLFLELTATDRELACTQVRQDDYPNESSYWNAYVNQLCLNKFITYIDNEPDLKQTPSIWPQQQDLASRWSIINGSVLRFDDIRLTLIPLQLTDITEFRIQREWIDLANWSSHYFIAVQVNLDDGWLQVWGYSTHQQFCSSGVYDPIDETYSLPIEDITEDLSAFWIAQELGPAPTLTPATTETLSQLSQAEAERILIQLSASSEYSPRLNFPFKQWGALISNPQYLKDLYHRRLHPVTTDKSEKTSQLSSLVTYLGQWLQQGTAAGWQTVDQVFSITPDTTAFAFRQNQSNTRGILIEGVKLIDLGVQLGHQSVALVVGITPIEEKRMGVQVQLLPGSSEGYLPTGVKVSLISQSNQVLQAAVARYQDSLMQLKRFSCPETKGFMIRVELGEFSLTEAFEIKPMIEQ